MKQTPAPARTVSTKTNKAARKEKTVKSITVQSIHEESNNEKRYKANLNYRPANPYVLYNENSLRSDAEFITDCYESMDALLVYVSDGRTQNASES